MIYPPDVEQKLGVDQLRVRLAQYCLSGLGLKELDGMQFSDNFSLIQLKLFQTLEFKQIIEKQEAFPEQHFFDPETLLKTAAIEGSFVEAEDLLKIAMSLQTVFECRAFLDNTADAYPELFKLSEPVQLSKGVHKSLTAKIDEHGGVKDNASVELAGIRRQLKAEQSRVRRLTEQIYRQAVSEGWVPEGATPALRDGRVVIPMASEHKRKLKGFIVDESSTGQTVYMEPAEVLEANNEIRDLEHAERREVVRILKELTTLLRDNLPEVEKAFIFLGQLEFNRAKAKLAVDMAASLPQLKPVPELNWRAARHPLLYLTLKGKRKVVPLTLDLTAHDRILLVSGPNAGGKSVCLKTVGLIQYMLQCGLLVPLDEKSSAGVFERIFLDIGDQQSIENDLSTYSSHLKNLNYFIQQATDTTLVLMDELGSGTDPDFGGGIGQAILDALLKKGVWGVVTTHYYDLKSYAAHQEGIRNGAMLFDSQKLEPLFQLEIGRPGSSFALEIARKTGLPVSILEAAEIIIGKELTGLEALMKTVAEDRQTLHKKDEELKLKEQALAVALLNYEKLSSALEGTKKEIINKAKNEASHLLKETNREIEKTIRHILENKAEKKETRKVRQGLRDLTEKIKPDSPAPVSIGVEIKNGDSVRIIGQEVSGTVLSLQGDQAVVQFGDLRSQIKTNQLIRSDLADSNTGLTKMKFTGYDLSKKHSQFTTTLDVRGKRAEEVIALIDQFLDDGIVLGRSELRILHGKGEGVLRKIIRERLKATPQVASFGNEHVERGGDGITIVMLK